LRPYKRINPFPRFIPAREREKRRLENLKRLRCAASSHGITARIVDPVL
jgi:hypothetical protein